MIKESIIEKITLPKDWKMLPFGDVCEISGGSQPPKPTFIYEPKEGYIRLVQVRDYRTNNFITYIPEEKAKKFCNKTDIMIGRYGPPIFGIFRGLEGAYNVALMKAIPNKELLNQEYLYWFLKTDSLVKFVEKSSKRAAGQDGVRKEVLYTYPTPIPPLTQQKQIVASLNKAFAAIDIAKANAQQNLQNAKELFESYLQNVFENKGDDWDSSELNEFVSFIDYRGRTPVKTISGVRLITAKNIKLGYLQVKPEEFIAEDNYESWMTRGIPNFGDVIFTTEAPLGHIAQVNTEEKIAFAQRVIVMQPDSKKINQTFLKYLLLSNPIRNKILAQATGATVLGIKSRLLKKIGIDFPKSIEKQEGIVKNLDSLSAETKKLEAIYIQKIADLEEMKKSVLQKAFSGQLNTIN